MSVANVAASVPAINSRDANAEPAASSCENFRFHGQTSVEMCRYPFRDSSRDRAYDHNSCALVSRVIRSSMDNISVRELRNNGGRVLKRVAGGETLTVTMDGQPIAELRPIPGRGLTAATLLQRWRRLPPVDAQQLRADLDRVLNASLWPDG